MKSSLAEAWDFVRLKLKRMLREESEKSYRMINIDRMRDKSMGDNTMSKYILEKGSPEDYSDRLEKEQRCYKLLDDLKIEYYRCDHPDANADTMEACLEIDCVLEAAVCKNLFLCNRQHTDFYLLMMPGDKVFKTKELSSQLGCARLSFASGEEMEEYLDITPGSVSVLGLMNDTQNKVRLIVDEDLLACEYIGCHPCINTASLKIATKDMFGTILEAMHHDMTSVKLVGEALHIT